MEKFPGKICMKRIRAASLSSNIPIMGILVHEPAESSAGNLFEIGEAHTCQISRHEGYHSKYCVLWASLSRKPERRSIPCSGWEMTGARWRIDGRRSPLLCATFSPAPSFKSIIINFRPPNNSEEKEAASVAEENHHLKIPIYQKSRGRRGGIN